MSILAEEDVARGAAGRLAPEMPDGFVEAVEAELAAGPGRPPQTYIEPVTAIALGGLLVNAAGLAWTIYKDLKKETPKPARSVVARRVRLRLADEGYQENRDSRRIVEAVVEEVVAGPE